MFRPHPAPSIKATLRGQRTARDKKNSVSLRRFAADGALVLFSVFSGIKRESLAREGREERASHDTILDFVPLDFAAGLILAGWVVDSVSVANAAAASS
jgi:hypothetical protein